MIVEIVCRDILFITRLEGLLQGLELEFTHRTPPGVHGNGPQPALGIIDLALGSDALRQEALSANHPLIAFGPHVATDLLAEAKSLGCRVVLTRSALAARLRPSVIALLELADTL